LSKTRRGEYPPTGGRKGLPYKAGLVIHSLAFLTGGCDFL
jgi:hypothetical protein